jgi:biopolymer transport protein TolR
MVTAPLIAPSIIELPSVGKAAKQPDKVVQIVIGKDESLELKIQDKSSRTTLKELAAAVKKAQSGASNAAVVISADRSVKYEVVVKVMDNLQRAGVQRVGLSVQLAN